MKRILTIILALAMSLVALLSVGCNKPTDGSLKFYAPDGAPALAIAKFINDQEDFGIDAKIDYHVVSSSDIGGVMNQAKGDFIVMPINAASKLYKANKNSSYVMTAVITHGNLYLMSSNGITTLEGLKGNVVGVIGQGLVPDLTLKAILSANGLLDDVVVGDTAIDGKIVLRYFADAQSMLPLLKQDVLSVGLLPEPAATKLTAMANDKTWQRLDVQQLYDSQAQSYPQAVLMVKKSVYDKYKQKIDDMENLFSQNVLWIEQNPTLAVTAVNSKLSQGLTPSLVANNITANVIQNCKIYYQSASSAKQSVINYINKIIEIAPNSAKVISDDFFA